MRINVIVAVFIGLLTAASSFAEQRFVDDTFEDFSKGVFDASGQNLYVNARGEISTIHRFDLNDDGYLDLFFGNTHDIKTVIPPTLCSIGTDRKVTQTDIDIMGADKARVADLNGDGFMDVVFALKSNGLQTSRRFLTVAYGDANGWSNKRTAVLPALNPLDIAVLDYNLDGSLDIVVINKPYENSGYTFKQNIRIYLGQKGIFSPNRYVDIESGGRHLVAVDINGDKNKDLIVLNGKKNVAATAFLANSQSLPVTKDIMLPSDKCVSMAAGDIDNDGSDELIIGDIKGQFFIIKNQTSDDKLVFKSFIGPVSSDILVCDIDNDGFKDMVLSNFAKGTASMASEVGADIDSPRKITILWNDNGVFSKNNSTELLAKYASSIAAADVDKDGNTDLAIAIFQDEQANTFEARSIIYYGKGQREFEIGRDTIKTSGASQVVTLENSKKELYLIFCNSLGGTLFERVPAYVYFGTDKGFSTDNMLKVPSQSAHMGFVTDLNSDGFNELIVTNTAHGGMAALKNPIVGIDIFWGNKNGIDLKNPSILNEPWCAFCDVADLNRDGWLDLILGGWEPWLGDEVGQPAKIVIYYGSKNGFTNDKKQTLRCEGRSEEVVIADFNKDGQLDIACTSFERNCARIFWGSNKGFNQNNFQELSFPAPIGLETADLNADGWLDLIVCSYYDKSGGAFDMGAYIVWGSAKGFSDVNAQWLPGNCTDSPCVADFDDDGSLDIFFPSYHSQNTRESIPSYLFWGNNGKFNWTKRTEFICDSSTDAMAGDFNRDGRLDLAVSCHTRVGNHQTDSKVFYNSRDKRFDNPIVSKLPTLGAHYVYVHDVGNIYDRKLRQSYVSRIFHWNEKFANGTLSSKVTNYAKNQSSLIWYIRTADSEQGLLHQPWTEIDSAQFSIPAGSKFLQYKVILCSKNGDAYPTIDRVEIILK